MAGLTNYVLGGCFALWIFATWTFIGEGPPRPVRRLFGKIFGDPRRAEVEPRNAKWDRY